MGFEYDERKNKINLFKHGISLKESEAIFKDPLGVCIQAESKQEDRYLIIGKYKEKLWACIFTYRDCQLRLISTRRARKYERELYEEEEEKE